MVLSTFILWFDICSNLSSVSRSGGTDAGPAIATITSSTRARSFMTGPPADGVCPSWPGMGMPLMRSSSRSIRICTSCTKMYSSGLRGQPCLIPAVFSNGLPSSQFSLTEVDAALYIPTTAFTKGSGRWNARIVSNKKAWSTLSNAFSLSRKSIIPPSPGCLWLMLAMVSRTRAMFSSYVLPGLNPTCGSPIRWAMAGFSFSAMHLASIRYSIVVTDTGRYIFGSHRSPFSLYIGLSTACRMVCDTSPRCNSSR